MEIRMSSVSVCVCIHATHKTQAVLKFYEAPYSEFPE